MIRYVLASLALKAFSTSTVTKGVYRSLGNRFGGPLARRKSYLQSHIKRSQLFHGLCKKYDVLQEGDRLLEIGTGWIHWHSLYQRLFYDVKITMLDVWDCRQFDAMHKMFSELKQTMKKTQTADTVAISRLNTILLAKSFDELYSGFNLDYVVNTQGSLKQFADKSMACVFSFHVLEHVPKRNTPELVKNINRILKPGGYSIHQIGIDDHLTHYDKKESPKNYIRYSDRMWHLLFENEIQYINRLQMSDWIALFGEHGLSSIETIPYYCDIDGLKINNWFDQYSREDLKCTILTLVHQKPLI